MSVFTELFIFCHRPAIGRYTAASSYLTQSSWLGSPPNTPNTNSKKNCQKIPGRALRRWIYSLILIASNIRWFYYLLIDALQTLAWDMLCFVDHLWHRIWAGCFIRTKQEGLWYSSYCKFIPKFFRHYSWNKLDDKTESLCLYFQVRNISIDCKQPTLNAANLVWDLRDVSVPRSKVKPC